MSTWDGDIGGDLALTRQMTRVTVSSFGRTAFALKWFQRRGLCHSAEGDAWWEYNGNTTHLSDANLLATGVWEGLPTVDLGRG